MFGVNENADTEDTQPFEVKTEEIVILPAEEVMSVMFDIGQEWTEDRNFLADHSMYLAELAETDGYIPAGSITMEVAEFVSANVLEAYAYTTGERGGDAGHGGRTFVMLRNVASTAMSAYAHGDNVVIALGGDTELDTFIDALRWMADSLERQRDRAEKITFDREGGQD